MTQAEFYNLIDFTFPNDVTQKVTTAGLRNGFKALAGKFYSELLKSLPSVGTAAELSALTLESALVIYDGSVWERKTGAPTGPLGVQAPSAVAGTYWNRAYGGYVNVLWFGAVGDGTATTTGTDNTAMLQAAIDWVIAHANPATSTLAQPYRGRSATLYCPAGTYDVKGELLLHGAINIVGDGGLSYGGTFWRQRSSNKSLFRLQPDTDGGSNCVTIQSMRLTAIGSGAPDQALVYAPTGTANGNNSLILKDVWFQGWEKYAVCHEKGDDVEITGCRFDGATNQAFCFGLAFDAAATVSNVRIDNNTFYDVQGGIGYIPRVRNFSFTNNHVYGTAAHQTPFVIDAVTFSAADPVSVKIHDNTLEYTNLLYKTKSAGFSVQCNIATKCTGRMIEFGGGGVVAGGLLLGNTYVGLWTGALNVGTQANPSLVPDAPIFAYGTGVTGVRCSDRIISTGASPTSVYLPDARSLGNEFEVLDSGFTGNILSAIVNPAANITRYRPRPALFTFTLSTAGWSTSAYNQIIASGVLAANTAYLVKLVYDKSGLDAIVEVFTLAASASYPGAAAYGNLTGTVSSYNNTRNLDVRFRNVTTANTTLGLEARVSNNDMANGTLTVTLTPLL